MNEPATKTARKPRDGTAASDETKARVKKRTKDPVAALAGIFKDDPTWDEFMEAMRRARAEEEAMEDVPH